MLVSKIKPCMSKYKQIVRRNCEWLIKSVIVYLMVPYYLDNRGLGMQPKLGGKLRPRLNTGERPIANKYREGKMKRTLKRESKSA